RGAAAARGREARARPRRRAAPAGRVRSCARARGARPPARGRRQHRPPGRGRRRRDVPDGRRSALAAGPPGVRREPRRQRLRPLRARRRQLVLAALRGALARPDPGLRRHRLRAPVRLPRRLAGPLRLGRSRRRRANRRARRRLPRAALAVRVRRAAAPLPPALGGVPPPCRLLREPAPPLPGARLETRRLPLYLVRTSGHNGPSPERACRRRARLVRLARTGCGLRQQLRGAPPGRRALPARRPAPSGGVAAARAALAEAPPDPAAVVPLDRPPVEVLAPPRPACGRGQPRGRRRRPAPREALAAAARAV